MIAASSIELIENPPDEFGESVAASSPAAYFYHTPRYQRFWEEAVPRYKDASLGFVFDDGTKAFLPLLSMDIAWGMWRRYESSIRSYGGPIAETELSPERKLALINRTLDWVRSRRLYTLTVTTSPLSPEIAVPSTPGSRIRARREQAEAEVLALPSSIDELAHGFAKGRRSDIKRAERSGITVRVADSEQDFRDFCDIYQDRVRRWGERAKNRFQIDFFLALRRLSERTTDAQLWLASDAGRVWAGAVVFYHRDRAIYWLSASLEDDSKRPNAYLQYRIMEDAIARGITLYDMGRSGTPGVKAFKSHFGATPRGYEILSIENAWAMRTLAFASRVRRGFRRGRRSS